ncbi:hypothetical protein GT346_11935 [Streptomyces sp. SID161]|nr:hypothetical protein [Streptomyces sp. SID161]
MVRADRLRFAEEPRTAVRFPGGGRRHSMSHSDRTHLPDEVEPGADYQDVTVAYRLATRLLWEGPGSRTQRRRPPPRSPDRRGVTVPVPPHDQAT